MQRKVQKVIDLELVPETKLIFKHFEFGIERYFFMFLLSFVETHLDPCSPNPCQNGGICNSNSEGFTCSCASGYTGDDCGTNGIVDCLFAFSFLLR